MTAVADDGGRAALGGGPGSADVDAVEQEAKEGTSAEGNGAKENGSGPNVAGERAASTATAAGIIIEQVKEGDVKIQGVSDTGAPP